MASIAISFIDPANGVVTSSSTFKDNDIQRIYKALATHYAQNDKQAPSEFSSQEIVDRFRDNIIENLVNTAMKIEYAALYEEAKRNIALIEAR